MTPKQRRQVETLYHAAARPLGERTAWLAEACVDADLRGKMQRLLAQPASKASASESGRIGSGSD